MRSRFTMNICNGGANCVAVVFANDRNVYSVGCAVLAGNGYISDVETVVQRAEIAATNRWEMGRVQEQAVMVNDTLSTLE